MDKARRFSRISLTAIALFGCEVGPELETVQLGNSTYVVPSSYIFTTINADPVRHIRIQPPKEAFALVYDSRTMGKKDASGAPVLFSLNEGPTPGIEHLRLGTRLITCRKASSPNEGCGLHLRHGGVEWVVLIPESRLGEAEKFAAEAARLLDRFKQD